MIRLKLLNYCIFLFLLGGLRFSAELKQENTLEAQDTLQKKDSLEQRQQNFSNLISKLRNYPKILDENKELNEVIGQRTERINNLMNDISNLKRGQKFDDKNNGKSKKEMEVIINNDEEVSKKRLQLLEQIIARKKLKQVTHDIRKMKFFNVEDAKVMPKKQKERESKNEYDLAIEESSSQSEEYVMEENHEEFDTQRENLTAEEEQQLQETLFKMNDLQVQEKFNKITKKKNLYMPAYLQLSSYDIAFNGLIMARHLYKKKNVNTYLKNTLMQYYYCKIHLKKDGSTYNRVIRVNKKFKAQLLKDQTFRKAMKDNDVIDYGGVDTDIRHKEDSDAPAVANSADKKKQFGLNFHLLKQFNSDFNNFCELIENMNFYFGQILTETGLAKSKDVHDAQETINAAGTRLENVIRKYYKRYNDIKDNMESYIERLYRAIEVIDCDVRDMMSFYLLLPRFHLVYKKIYRSLKSNDNSVIIYYRDKIVEILYKWQTYNSEIFKYFSILSFWAIMAEGIFELSNSITQNIDFKYTMLERSIEVWLDMTTLAQSLQMNSDLMLESYATLYQELTVLFEGLEAYINLKIPFPIVPLSAKSSVNFLSYFIVGAFWFLFTK